MRQITIIPAAISITLSEEYPTYFETRKKNTYTQINSLCANIWVSALAGNVLVTTLVYC
jgi:EamA domain-containing membrane protein RarD